MKVLYLNVFRGCQEPQRFNKLIKYINAQRPDVLGLCELNGWDARNMSKLLLFSKKTGFKFKSFCKSPHGYHIALFSRLPFLKEESIQAGLWHCAIINEIMEKGKKYTIALTHLSYVSESIRINEVNVLLRKLGKCKRTILMGDMNSLSPLDKIDDSALLKIMKKSKMTKFGKNKINKAVIGKILKKGFVDTTKLLSSSSKPYSVPTAYNIDKAHFTKLRLDYIFVSKDLEANITAAGIQKNKTTDTLSDHYPVFAVMGDRKTQK